MSKKFENEPVIFVAVNSGNSPAEVAEYAKSVRLPWPVLADVSRQFEQKAGVGEVSLSNVHQVAVVTGAGEIRRASFSDIPASIQRAKVGASWKVDPRGIPASLKPTWRLVEFGKYSAAAKGILRGRTSAKADIKQAAEAMFAVIDKELQEEGRIAWNLGQDEKFYEAYVAMTNFKEKFQGFDIPQPLLKAHRWLGQKKEVRDEMKAQQLLREGTELLGAPNPNIRKRAVAKLEGLLKRYPETSAAAEAQRALDAATGEPSF